MKHEEIDLEKHETEPENSLTEEHENIPTEEHEHTFPQINTLKKVINKTVSVETTKKLDKNNFTHKMNKHTSIHQGKSCL